MRRHHFLLLFFLLVSLPSVVAQTPDSDETEASYGLSASVDHKLAKGLHLEGEAELRMLSGFSDMERWALSLGIDYKLLSWLKADAGYAFINRYKTSKVTNAGNVRNGFWSPRHRWYGSLSGSYDIGRWSWSLRERYQYTYAPLQYVPKYTPAGKRLTDEAEAGTHEHLLRSRLAVSYNIRHSKFEPEASIEFHNDLSRGFSLDEIRYVCSLDYKLSKVQTFSLTFRYTDNRDDDDATVLLVGYSYKF